MLFNDIRASSEAFQPGDGFSKEELVKAGRWDGIGADQLAVHPKKYSMIGLSASQPCIRKHHGCCKHMPAGRRLQILFDP